MIPALLKNFNHYRKIQSKKKKTTFDPNSTTYKIILIVIRYKSFQISIQLNINRMYIIFNNLIILDMLFLIQSITFNSSCMQQKKKKTK